jgi:hypothetical protein
MDFRGWEVKFFSRGSDKTFVTFRKVRDAVLFNDTVSKIVSNVIWQLRDQNKNQRTALWKSCTHGDEPCDTVRKPDNIFEPFQVNLTAALWYNSVSTHCEYGRESSLGVASGCRLPSNFNDSPKGLGIIFANACYGSRPGFGRSDRCCF